MNNIIENTQRLLHVARIMGVPVIISEQSTYLLGGLINELTDYLSEETIYIEKTSFSCCGENEFLEIIKKLERNQIILTGLEAHISVLQTAIELKEQGYDVFVAGDATGSRFLGNYTNGLRRLMHSGISITSTEAVGYEWLRGVRNDQFEEVISIYE